MLKISKQTSKRLLYVGFVALGIFFVFLRLYKIESSYLFQNDAGRDLLVLYRWMETGIPPLLGPQTSALPLNQSAVYFYLLYPIYLITKMSFFSANYTLVLFYLIFLSGGVFFLKSKSNLLKVLIVVGYLITIHPQLILQNRSVWNPSFVAPLILATFLIFELIKEESSRWLFFLFSFSLAMAISLNYSVFPTFLAFLILFVWRMPKKVSLLIFNFLISFFLVNLPMLIFELRHNFFLTKLFFNWGRVEQSQTGWSIKIDRLYRFLIMAPSKRSEIFLLVVIIGAILYGIYFFRKRGTKEREYQIYFDAVVLFVMTLVLILMMPFSIQAHYVFGVLVLGFVMVSLLPMRIMLLVLFLVSIVWLRPSQLNKYFVKAPRTIAESVSCAEMVCNGEKEPLFVSVQSGFHPYHSGPEFRYLFKTAGCTVVNIETDSDGASLMAVVADGSSYEHEKTLYNELTMFGKSEEVRVYTCNDNLKVHILSADEEM